MDAVDSKGAANDIDNFLNRRYLKSNKFNYDMFFHSLAS